MSHAFDVFKTRRGPTAEENRASKTDDLLARLQTNKARKEAEKKASPKDDDGGITINEHHYTKDQLQAALQTIVKLTNDPCDVAMSGAIIEEDQSVKVVRQVQTKAPAHVKALFDEEDVFQIPGFLWRNMNRNGRVEIVAKFGLRAVAIDSFDLLDVFPENSLDWLARYQRIVNDGTAYNVGRPVGEMANAFIGAGLLMESKRHYEGVWYDSEKTRGELPPGAPGTVGFVRLISGPRYARWLDAID